MISLPGHTVLHVIGRARPGDPTTAAARALCRRLDRIGRPGRLVSIAPAPGLPDVARPGATALAAAPETGRATGGERRWSSGEISGSGGCLIKKKRTRTE